MVMAFKTAAPHTEERDQIWEIRKHNSPVIHFIQYISQLILIFFFFLSVAWPQRNAEWGQGDKHQSFYSLSLAKWNYPFRGDQSVCSSFQRTWNLFYLAKIMISRKTSFDVWLKRRKKNGFMVFFCTLLLLCAFCPTVKQMNGLCPSGLTGKKTGVLQLLALIALPLWRVWKLTIQVGIKYTLSDAKQTTLKPLQWPETLAQIHANGECTRNRQVTVTKNFMSLHFEHKLVSGTWK